MKDSTDRITQLIHQLDRMLARLDELEELNAEVIASTDVAYRQSAKNLLHYTALRKQDLRSFQQELKSLGMSRLANAGGHVRMSLLLSRQILSSLIGQASAAKFSPGLSIKQSKELLARHTDELMGPSAPGRRVRIMVTQPTEAAHHYPLVREMVRSGMDCARINCAHDGPEVWTAMIDNLKKASRELGKKVVVTMDLAGPKIRTGPITPGPQVKKFSPRRDELGKVVSPALVVLVDELTPQAPPNAVAVNAAWRVRLRVGDRMVTKDTRGKKRKFRVARILEDQVWLYGKKTAYLGTGTTLRPLREDLEPTQVGALPPVERAIPLKPDDILVIHRERIPGEAAYRDAGGMVLRPAHISCQESRIFGKVSVGDRILFDDGKIEGQIVKTVTELFHVRITRAREQGAKLKAEKGINFPTTDLGISGLTPKDREDLQFVARHADVVNFSFVNSGEDVAELLRELDRLQAKGTLSINLKIETRKAFDNLTEILLAAMQARYVGVMIARGDLAVETGWDNIGWVQREILKLCEAAHIPVIWATQVLENLAKKGLPSRSEITDATASLRAECVMLNKGAYVQDAIALLDKILRDMEDFEEKNDSMLPLLKRLSE